MAGDRDADVRKLVVERLGLVGDEPDIDAAGVKAEDLAEVLELAWDLGYRAGQEAGATLGRDGQGPGRGDRGAEAAQDEPH